MNSARKNPEPQRKPPWLRRRLPSGPEYNKVRELLKKGRLHTVCQEAQCPNIFECFCSGTATFLILGDRCTRQCRFCAVHHGPLLPPDPEEAENVARAAEELKLRYVVVTSVTRDDLPDGGAEHFAETIRAIHKCLPETKVEVLIPDFQGNADALRVVLDAKPDVLNHNLETVPRLYPDVRPEAVYERSLELLDRVHRFAPRIPGKSGLMLGLGEKPEEIRQVLRDLRKAHCRLLTLGQYLQPTRENLPVERYVEPEEFDRWKEEALEIGFDEVASGPFVRSSYRAENSFEKLEKPPE
ncbi:MAG: lipoyl synthase [Candidatus Sumerlaeia bacterium]